MAIVRKDEILEKALSSDASAIPRYNIFKPDGSVIGENVTLELVNAINQHGTPINASALNEMLSASGVTAGTSIAYTLAQAGFYLFDGAPIRFRLHTESDAGARLNVNGTGSKAIVNTYGNPMPAGIPAGIWIDAMYSQVFDAFVLVGFNAAKWVTDVTSTTQAVEISLPDGFDILHLCATFYTDDTYAGVSYATDVAFTGNAVGADSGDATEGYAGRVYSSVTNANHIATATIGRRSFVDMMIYRLNGKTTVQGTSGGGRVAGFSNFSESTLRRITVTPDSAYDNISTGTIILEGIA